MLALGGLLAGGALLTLVALTPIFRRPAPPRWTTAPLVGELITIAIVSAFALGLGFLGAGAYDAYEHGPGALDVAVLVGLVLLFVLAWRQLRGRKPEPVTRPGAAGLGQAAVHEPRDPPPAPRPQRRAA